MKSLFKIFTILTPDQIRQCIFIVIAMVIGAVLESIGIGAILPLISIMGEPEFLANHVLVARIMEMFGVITHTSFVIICSGSLVVVYIFKNAYMAWQTKLQIDFAIKNQVYYSEQLLANYLSKPYLFHLDHNSATLLRNVNNGGATAFSGILIPTFGLLTEVITAAAIWCMLVYLDPFTAIVVAGLMGGMLFLIIESFRHSITRQGAIQNGYAAEYYKWLNQAFGAIKEIKVLCKEDFFLTQYSRAYVKCGQANGKFMFLSQAPRMIIETLVVSGLLVLIITKIFMGQEPMDIVPLLGVLALAAFRLMPSANRIVNLSNCIKFQMPLFDELYEEFLAIRRRRIENHVILLPSTIKNISFKQILYIQNLTFYYPGSKEAILKDVTFVIPKGKFVGIVGPSGAGKTTFVDILLGLLAPTDGAIIVDHIDIQQDIQGWQANLSYVPQTIYLIDGTIRENIALGVRPEDIDDARIEQVMEMAELHGFVHGLPDNIHTMVGERGVKLSGGQRQRIGIARALYYRPEVIILDEATSALDSETEKSITDTILKLKGKITIIAIAHRVSTLEACDFKVKFEDGRAELISL